MISTSFFNNTYKYIIINSKIQCLAINAHHHLQVRSIGRSGLQNGCQLHYHTSDSVLSSWCSFISQHISIKICIMLAILGRCIKSEKSAQGWDVCEYAYLAATLTISENWAPRFLPVGADGVSGRGGVSSAVGCLHRSGGDVPDPMCLHRVCGLFAVPLWQGSHLAVWIWRNIAGCLSVAAFTFLRPGNSTPHLIFSQTSAWGVLICNCISSIEAHKHPPLAILPIFKARRMSDCSSCTRPPYLAMVADMLKTYKELVAACNNEIWRLPHPYMLP